MQHSIEQWLSDKLGERRVKDLWRALPSATGSVDFTSNDYLGLAQSKELFEEIRHKIETLPKKNGATGSRLLSGNSSYTEEVENKLAGIFKSSAALIFNSGYAANLAVLSAIPQKGDTIICDELAHASIKDGARLSLAKRFGFRHNDIHDLERKIRRSQGRVFIVVESLYSMDGDECPLEELTLLAEKYDASIILDEAHSTGVLGDRGSGLAVSRGLHDKVIARVYTFGKALGVHGACVAGSSSLIQYLINFARPFIYTTALPPHGIVAIDCAMAYLQRKIHLQSVLQSKIDLFTKNASYRNRIASRSAIQTVLIPGNTAAKRAALLLQQKGYDIRAILTPTVPENQERLRICIHAFNTDKDICDLATILSGQKKW